MARDTIMTKALRLPTGKRAELAAALLRSLDTPDARECEEAWLHEAEQRYAAYKRGDARGIVVDAAIREARSRLV